MSSYCLSDSVLGALNLAQVYEADTGNELIHLFIQKAFIEYLLYLGIILDSGDKKMSKAQRLPTRRCSLKMYHGRAQSPPTAPSPV